MKNDTSLSYARYLSPMGRMVLANSSHGLAGAWFEGQQHMPDMTGWTLVHDLGEHPLLAQAAYELSSFFMGDGHRFSVPLDLQAGSDFQRQVWSALLDIGYGETVSYGDLARRLGRPTGARAVGTAVGRNPVSVIVPCHRVIGADGSLTGYAGGIERKTALLQFEAARGMLDIVRVMGEAAQHDAATAARRRVGAEKPDPLRVVA